MSLTARTKIQFDQKRFVSNFNTAKQNCSQRS